MRTDLKNYSLMTVFPIRYPDDFYAVVFLFEVLCHNSLRILAFFDKGGARVGKSETMRKRTKHISCNQEI